MSEEEKLEQKTTDRPAEVDGSGSGGEAKHEEPWKNYLSAVQRSHKRTMEKLEALEERLNSFSQTSNGNHDASDPRYATPSAFADTSLYATSMTPQDIEALAERKASEVIGKEKTQREFSEAIKYVESLDFLKDSDEGQEELYDIMNEHEMDWKKKPLGSVRAAVSIYKDRHGLSKDTATSERQAAGTQGATKTPQSSGGKVYKVSELAKLSKENPLEFKRMLPELIEAKQQGRWIND